MIWTAKRWEYMRGLKRKMSRSKRWWVRSLFRINRDVFGAHDIYSKIGRESLHIYPRNASRN